MIESEDILTPENENYIRAPASEVRDKILVGLEQAKRGELVDGKTAIQKIRDNLKQRDHGGE